MVAFDPSVAWEGRKTRPEMVLSNDEANAVLNRVQVVAVSSNVAVLYPAEAYVLLNGRRRKAMADQISTVSVLRLRRRMGLLGRADIAGSVRFPPISACIRVDLSASAFDSFGPLHDCWLLCYKQAMNCEDIVARLRENEAQLRARGVMHAALFGSRARGDAREDSDTDIMIEIDPDARIGVWDYVGIKDFIAGLFEGSVDVVKRKTLKPYVRPSVLADAIYAF